MLVHIEGLWEENLFTAEGGHLHERVHETGGGMENGVLTARSLRLRSLALGLSGVADTVEFHPVESGGVGLPHRPGRWMPYPVEYKRGRPKRDICDAVQLCAQAICLEEMLGGGLVIPTGALYYGQPRRRTEVPLTPDLRADTEALAARLHALIRAGRTPQASYEKKCESCSLIELCMPKTAGRAKSARRYLEGAFAL